MRRSEACKGHASNETTPPGFLNGWRLREFLNRKPLIFPWNMGFSCDFSIIMNQPIGFRTGVKAAPSAGANALRLARSTGGYQGSTWWSHTWAKQIAKVKAAKTWNDFSHTWWTMNQRLMLKSCRLWDWDEQNYHQKKKDLAVCKFLTCGFVQECACKILQKMADQESCSRRFSSFFRVRHGTYNVGRTIINHPHVW